MHRIHLHTLCGGWRTYRARAYFKLEGRKQDGADSAAKQDHTRKSETRMGRMRGESLHDETTHEGDKSGQKATQRGEKRANARVVEEVRGFVGEQYGGMRSLSRSNVRSCDSKRTGLHCKHASTLLK